MVVGAAAMAINAGSASATVHWSDTTKGIKASGTLKVTDVQAKSTMSCVAEPWQENLMSSNNALIWTIEAAWGNLEFDCGAPILGLDFQLSLKTVTSVQVGGNNMQAWNPFGWTYYSSPAIADWANGSGATPSKLTFVNDTIGFAPGSPSSHELKANGSLNITTSAGGLLTVLP
jgi:hypothetical protein